MRYVISVFLFFMMSTSVAYAQAFDGLVASELPPGGDVTVPGEFSVLVPQEIDVLFSGNVQPQALTISNKGSVNGEVKIFSNQERQVRTVKIGPGESAVYTFRNKKPVRMKVISGDIRVSSLQSLKVQR